MLSKYQQIYEDLKQKIEKMKFSPIHFCQVKMNS